VTFPLEDLRNDIVDLFDAAADLTSRPRELEELPLTVALRDLRLQMKGKRVPRVVLEPKRQAGSHSELVCASCGARAPGHRCPVLGWVV
jgi:hypothetical protein